MKKINVAEAFGMWGYGLTSVKAAYAAAKKEAAKRRLHEETIRHRRMTERQVKNLPRFVAAYKAAAIAWAVRLARDVELTAELQAFVNGGCKALVTKEVRETTEKSFNFDLQRFAENVENEFYVRRAEFELRDGAFYLNDNRYKNHPNGAETLIPRVIVPSFDGEKLRLKAELFAPYSDDSNAVYSLEAVFDFANNETYVSPVSRNGEEIGVVVGYCNRWGAKIKNRESFDYSIRFGSSYLAKMFNLPKTNSLGKLLFFRKHGIKYDVDSCEFSCQHALQIWHVLGEKGDSIVKNMPEGFYSLVCSHVNFEEVPDGLRFIAETKRYQLLFDVSVCQDLLSADFPIPARDCDVSAVRNWQQFIPMLKYARNKSAVMDVMRKGISCAKASILQDILESAFRVRFGRVPRVIYDIAVFYRSNMVFSALLNRKWEILFKFVDEFKPKVLAANLKRGSKKDAIAAYCYLPGETRPAYNAKALKYAYEHKLIGSDAHKWLMSHHELSYENCMAALNHPGLEFSTIRNISELQDAIAKQRSVEEIQAFEDEYGVSFNELKSSIERNSVSDGQNVAEMLEPTDPEQVMLGYYTYCCQHMDGAGETAMAYGLISDNGGFFVVRRKGQVIAQAESWLAKEAGTLVFDNIELANDREVKTIFPILKKWLENSNYDNVVMGLGYNEVGEAIDLPEAPIPDFRDLDEIEEKFEDEVYTDADEACVYLKKNGEVMF